MDRMTEWNEELGSFLLKKGYAPEEYPTEIDLINYIGVLENEIEKLKMEKQYFFLKYKITQKTINNIKEILGA
jgi:hypothetical protein